MINKVILLGNLGKDCEVKYGANGAAYLQNSLATTDGFGDKKSTEWHNIVLFGKTAEAIAKYGSKGQTVYIEGRIVTEVYDKKDGSKGYSTKIIADKARLVGRGKDHAEGEAPAGDIGGDGGLAERKNHQLSLDDIPF